MKLSNLRFNRDAFGVLVSNNGQRWVFECHRVRIFDDASEQPLRQWQPESLITHGVRRAELCAFEPLTNDVLLCRSKRGVDYHSDELLSISSYGRVVSRFALPASMQSKCIKTSPDGIYVLMQGRSDLTALALRFYACGCFERQTATGTTLKTWRGVEVVSFAVGENALFVLVREQALRGSSYEYQVQASLSVAGSMIG